MKEKGVITQWQRKPVCLHKTIQSGLVFENAVFDVTPFQVCHKQHKNST